MLHLRISTTTNLKFEKINELLFQIQLEFCMIGIYFNLLLPVHTETS